MIPTLQLGAMGRGFRIAAGISPALLLGTTFLYDGNAAAASWKTQNTTDGEATANDDDFQRGDSISPTTRCFSGAGGTRKIPVVGDANGFNYDSLLADVKFGFYTKPAPGSNPVTVTSIGTLCTNANAIICFAIRVVDATLDNGNPYGNARLLGDSGGYLGLFCYKNAPGTHIVFQAYSYNSGNKVREASVPINTWCVVMMAHMGGQLYIFIDDAQVGASLTAGNTDLVTGDAWLGGNSTIDVAALFTCNAANTTPQLLEARRWMGNRIGRYF